MKNLEADLESETLKEDLFYLTGFLLTSAQNLYHEPQEYGVYRLLDAAGRLLSIMDTHGLADDFLRNLGQMIEEEKAASMDSDRQKETVGKMAMEYTRELKRRLSGEL